jgi:hypothetical protein
MRMVVDMHTQVVTPVPTRVVTPILRRMVPRRVFAKPPTPFFREVVAFVGRTVIHYLRAPGSLGDDRAVVRWWESETPVRELGVGVVWFCVGCLG